MKQQLDDLDYLNGETLRQFLVRHSSCAPWTDSVVYIDHHRYVEIQCRCERDGITVFVTPLLDATLA